jgi:Tfp pilus assembly protein PilF
MSADSLLERDTDQLLLPAGAVVHARLGPYARVTLLGPARLAVLTGGPVTAVRLDAGVLIGEYEHHQGSTLVVHSPAATTTIVGTLFSVEATDRGGSRVAVRRGAVIVQSQAERIHLGPGWSWSSGEAAQPVIPEALVRQFAVHTAGSANAATPLPPATHAQPTPRRAPASESAAASSAAQLDAAVTPPSRGDAAPLSVTADSLYAQAEAAMRAGEHAVARAHLSELVRRFPSDGLADAALLDLARLAKEEGQPAAARSYLDTLLSRHQEQALLEPARYLRCRLDVDSRQYAQAATCLTGFRRDFPTSPHDAEVLALLIGLWQSEGDCQRAIPLLDEYQRRYPKGPLDARVRRARCER